MDTKKTFGRNKIIQFLQAFKIIPKSTNQMLYLYVPSKDEVISTAPKVTEKSSNILSFPVC